MRELPAICPFSIACVLDFSSFPVSFGVTLVCQRLNSFRNQTARVWISTLPYISFVIWGGFHKPAYCDL